MTDNVNLSSDHSVVIITLRKNIKQKKETTASPIEKLLRHFELENKIKLTKTKLDDKPVKFEEETIPNTAWNNTIIKQ